jgi:hypothetical protein
LQSWLGVVKWNETTKQSSETVTVGMWRVSDTTIGPRNGGWHLFHYTDDKGHKAISSQVVWLFKASKPPGDHLKAAYFSTLPPGTKNLSKRLFVRGCADKTRFVFNFSGGEELPRLRGGRGDHIHYSVEDYSVEQNRQVFHGETETAKDGPE